MAPRTRGRTASAGPATELVPSSFKADLLFHEKRSTLTLSRRDGVTHPPLLLEESGCRVSGAAGDRLFAVVLDEPGPAALRLAAGPLAEALAEPAAISESSARERASRWIDPVLAVFDRWTGDLSAGRAPEGTEIAGARMDATIVLARVAAARSRDGAPFIATRDLRASAEGRCAVTLRVGDRSLTIEASRWADPLADPPSSVLPGWHDAAAEALRRGLDLLDAVPPPAMEAPALFGPAASGILLHEICGHLLEADLVVSGVSPFARLLGERVASDRLTLVDDPRMPGARVRCLMDDEGRETRAAVLIEAGVLRGFLSDDGTAAATAGLSAASARRESYRCASLPRMTNLSASGGDQDPSDLMKPIARGLLVERLGRGQVDPHRGEFRLEVEAGRLIESGRPGRPVAGAFLVGSCRDLLRSIDGVGSDARIDTGAGSCIKDDQIVPVGQAAPSLRVAKVRVLPGVGP